MEAVITGDVVNSTLLQPLAEKQLLDALRNTFSRYTFEFYRGDSFQVYLPDARYALETAVKARIAALAVPPAPGGHFDLKIGIGLGSVEHPVRDLPLAKGEAFVLSGRGLDEMGRSDGRIVIFTNNKLAEIALWGIAEYTNSIFRQMTTKQAEVLLEMLSGDTQQQVAERLGRSKSTIHQHVTAGRWDELENILKKSKQLVELIS